MEFSHWRTPSRNTLVKFMEFLHWRSVAALFRNRKRHYIFLYNENHSHYCFLYYIFLYNEPIVNASHSHLLAKIKPVIAGFIL